MLTDTEEEDAARDEGRKHEDSDGGGAAAARSVTTPAQKRRNRTGLGSAAIGGMGIGMLIGGIPVIPLAAYSEELFGGATWVFYLFILAGGILGLLGGALWHRFR